MNYQGLYLNSCKQKDLSSARTYNCINVYLQLGIVQKSKALLFDYIDNPFKSLKFPL